MVSNRLKKWNPQTPQYCYIYRVWCVERMCFLKNSSQASWMGGWRLVGQEQLTTFPHLARLAPTCIFFPPILLRLGPTCSCCHFFPFPFLSILCLHFADVSCVSGTRFLLSHSGPALFCSNLWHKTVFCSKHGRITKTQTHGEFTSSCFTSSKEYAMHAWWYVML